MYAVVEFSSPGNSNEVAVVPLLWIFKNESRCYWPSKTNSAEIERIIIQSIPPNKYWPHYKVLKIHFKTVSYATAKNKLELLLANELSSGYTTKSYILKSTPSEDEEDERSDDEPLLKKCKTAMPSKLVAHSPHSIQHNITNVTEEQGMELVEATAGTAVAEENIPIIIVGPAEPPMVHRPTSFSTSTSTLTNFTVDDDVQISNETISNQVFQDTVLKALASMKATNEQILLTLNEVLRYNKKLALDKLVPPENLPSFPLQTVQEFDACENLVNDDPIVQQYMIRRLAALGGSGLDGTTRKIMKYLITDELGISFNWKGRHNKTPFEATRLMNIIYEAAKLNFPANEKNDETVAVTVKQWLKYSKARKQAREK